MTITCPCLYPTVIDDYRSGRKIEYIAFPEDEFPLPEEMIKPEFEKIKEKGFDGKMHDYIAVIFQNPTNAHTKKYDVNDHIVVMGCNGKVIDGKVQCKHKDLFMVLHPENEFEKYHKIKIGK